jgi:hypothetical protein
MVVAEILRHCTGTIGGSEATICSHLASLTLERMRESDNSIVTNSQHGVTGTDALIVG